MPTHIRALVGWQVGSTLPRDVCQITPCFRHQAVLPGGDPNFQTLADDLADDMSTIMGAASRQCTVKMYKIGEPEPNRPQAIAVRNPGDAADVNAPREVALCLSFYGGPNAPRNRGRLYFPWWTATTVLGGVRPSQAMREQIGSYVPFFSGLGGVDVDWIVWSPTANAATKVTNWFVDDEWDTQRRRGLKATTRTAGTTGG